MRRRIRIWKGDYDEDDDPNEIIELEDNSTYIWQDDPYYHSGSLGIDLHPDDCPATLNVYTSESVRSPPNPSSDWVEKAYWDGPIERGLGYPEDHDYPPFGFEIWGRVMFYVENND